MARETTIRQQDDGAEGGANDQFSPSGATFPQGLPPSSSAGTVQSRSVPGDTPEQADHDEELRPSRLKDVIGQSAVVERIRILLEASQMRKEPLGHLLLDGPPGLGKTTLASVIPKELGTDFQITSGPSLSAPKDLLPYLTNAGEGSVLFIDEIHRLPPAVEEFIYPAMEDFRVDITLGDGLNARTINMQLQPFTIIGATTRSGMLTAPLRDRFVNREHLSFYSLEELTTIVCRNAAKLRTDISADAARQIALRSRGTPRKANNWLRWTRDYADARVNGKITLDVADTALAMKGVDNRGLEELDRQYIETIITVFAGGPAGVQAIAHTMNIPADTLEDEIEPYLLREGLIQRSPRGRIITADAWKHVGKTPPVKKEQPDDDTDSQGTLF